MHTNLQNDWTPLQTAVIQKDLTAINDLLDKECEFHKPSKHGYKALDIAILKDDPEILEALLQKINPNDPEAQDALDNTPLHLAAKFLRLEAVRLLIGHHANVHAINKEGKKPAEVITNNIQDFIDLMNYWKHGPLNGISLSAFGFPDREDIEELLRQEEVKQDSISGQQVADDIAQEQIGKLSDI